MEADSSSSVKKETKTARPPRRLVGRLLRWIEHVLATVGLVMVVYWLAFDLTRITSDSMAPTLQGTNWKNGDLVLAERVSFWFRSPRRWEVIAFRTEDGRRVMKRVVGLPGERIQMLRGGRILIDGEEIFPPATLDFLSYFPFGNLTADQAVDCGEGYFVLGDESRDSDDSRFNGPVLPKDLSGRAWLILAPRQRAGWVR